MQYVYVLNKHGEPLMPCSPGKARLLLKQQKACVVKRTPFTIKLLYGSTGYKQSITLGVDAGSKHVGLSASTEKRELYREEFTPRNDVVDLLSMRRQNRRSRRNRKTRYRLWDKVLYKGQECFVSGRRASGSFTLKKLGGTRISKGVTFKKLRLLEPATNYLIERM